MNQYKSKIFEFQVSKEESIKLLNDLKTKEEDFVKFVEISEQMKKAANEDDLDKLKDLVDKNIFRMPYLQIFIDDIFEQMILYRYEEIIKYFLENGYKPNKNYLGLIIETSQYVRLNPPVELVELLLDYGVDINGSEEPLYRTPLHLACKYGIIHIIKLLVDKKADLNSVDKKRRTPLQQLKKSMKKFNNLEQIYEYMEMKGAKLDWKYDC